MDIAKKGNTINFYPNQKPCFIPRINTNETIGEGVHAMEKKTETSIQESKELGNRIQAALESGNVKHVSLNLEKEPSTVVKLLQKAVTIFRKKL